MVNVIDKERQGLDPALEKLLKEAHSDEEDKDNKDFVYCAQCAHLLGRAHDATTVQGQHQHFCTNPHGIDFNVRCYRNAPGCTISGRPTGADSWFAGYTWRFATCSNCNVHLGWLFETASGEVSQFYGLIADQIQIEDGPQS